MRSRCQHGSRRQWLRWLRWRRIQETSDRVHIVVDIVVTPLECPSGRVNTKQIHNNNHKHEILRSKCVRPLCGSNLFTISRNNKWRKSSSLRFFFFFFFFPFRFIIAPNSCCSVQIARPTMKTMMKNVDSSLTTSKYVRAFTVRTKSRNIQYELIHGTSFPAQNIERISPYRALFVSLSLSSSLLLHIPHRFPKWYFMCFVYHDWVILLLLLQQRNRYKRFVRFVIAIALPEMHKVSNAEQIHVHTHCVCAKL